MECIVPLSAQDAFALITDFRVHERWIPLTRITVPRSPLAEGDVVVAVTAGFLSDRMRVAALVPPAAGAPGRLHVRKEGPVLLGDAVIEVAPHGPA
jgi:hypothetical protein